MISVIVRKGSRTYCSSMSAVLRLLSLLALMLMPFGMGMGPAAATQPSHSMAGSMAEGHCDGSSGEQKSKVAIGLHCSAACTALPAEPTDVGSATILPAASPSAEAVQVFSGTIPPPATPPPRLG